MSAIRAASATCLPSERIVISARGGSAGSRVASAAAALVLLAGSPAGLSAQDAPVPEAMRRLEVFAGSWTTDSVEFLAADGSVRRVAGATARNALEMGGRVLAHRGRLVDPAVETRAWYFWDAEDRRLHLGSVSNRGRYDEFVGGWEGDRLVMVTRPSEPGDLVFRMTHGDFTGDSFLETMEVSEDGGASWRVTSRQRMHRVDAAPILTALDAYEGQWRSEDKTDPQGNPFHFQYDERWLDEEKTIAAIHIERVLPDGERTTVFRGFKGREPGGDGVYWVAASPSGRASRGKVRLEGRDLVTVYEGWTADGSTVHIRDVFGPVESGVFVSRTFLRRSPEEEWRQIGEDQWERIGAPR